MNDDYVAIQHRLPTCCSRHSTLTDNRLHPSTYAHRGHARTNDRAEHHASPPFLGLSPGADGRRVGSSVRRVGTDPVVGVGAAEAREELGKGSTSSSSTSRSSTSRSNGGGGSDGGWHQRPRAFDCRGGHPPGRLHDMHTAIQQTADRHSYAHIHTCKPANGGKKEGRKKQTKRSRLTTDT